VHVARSATRSSKDADADTAAFVNHPTTGEAGSGSA
jgi:hypothetical protein